MWQHLSSSILYVFPREILIFQESHIAPSYVRFNNTPQVFNSSLSRTSYSRLGKNVFFKRFYFSGDGGICLFSYRFLHIPFCRGPEFVGVRPFCNIIQKPLPFQSQSCDFRSSSTANLFQHVCDSALLHHFCLFSPKELPNFKRRMLHLFMCDS